MDAGRETNPVRDLVRLSDRDVRMLLKSLDQAQPSRKGTSGAYFLRVPWFTERDDGKYAGFIVHVRRVTPRDASLIHGGFVHTGTVCLLRLPGFEGSIRGSVAECRHVQGMLHEVDVQFDSSTKVEIVQKGRSAAWVPELPEGLTSEQVSDLVDDLVAVVERLDRAMKDRDFEAVRRAVGLVSDPAASLGLAELSESAQELGASLDMAGAVGAAAADVDALCDGLRRAACSLSGLVS